MKIASFLAMTVFGVMTGFWSVMMNRAEGCVCEMCMKIASFLAMTGWGAMKCFGI
jgi:hypothetical protein